MLSEVSSDCDGAFSEDCDSVNKAVPGGGSGGAPRSLRTAVCDARGSAGTGPALGSWGKWVSLQGGASVASWGSAVAVFGCPGVVWWDHGWGCSSGEGATSAYILTKGLSFSRGQAGALSLLCRPSWSSPGTSRVGQGALAWSSSCLNSLFQQRTGLDSG